MNRWNEWWFGEVAAARPYLLMKGFLLILVIDIFMTRLKSAVAFYNDPGGFRLSHFELIDRWLPSASMEIVMWCLLLSGWLALILVGYGVRRWMLGLLLATYTYSWLVSRVNLYQHYYFISWLLFGLLFWPSIEGAALWRLRTLRLQVSAWAYKMVVTITALVYVYTAIAKLDWQWMTGSTLKQIDGTESLLIFWGWVPALFDWERGVIYLLAANLAIGIELGLAVWLMLALGQDVRDKKGSRWLVGGWVVVMLMHLSMELMGLHIGLFSYYMWLVASVVLLPRSLVDRVGSLVGEVAVIMEKGVARLAGRVLGMKPSRATVVIFLTVVYVLTMGLTVEVPGWRAATVTIVGITIIGSGWMIKRRRMFDVTKFLTIILLGTTVMWSAAIIHSVPLRYRVYKALDLMRRGDVCEAGEWRRAAQQHVWQYNESLITELTDEVEWTEDDCEVNEEI